MTHRAARGFVWICLASVALGAVPGLLRADPARSVKDRKRAREAQGLQITVDTPMDGALIGDPGGMAFIAGKALAPGVGIDQFDLMFVIDRSESTSSPSGADVNGDGVVDSRACSNVPSVIGFFGAMVGACPVSKDSVLAAELLAVRTLLEQLDPRRTRVGIVAFSGDGNPLTADAVVRASLTSDYSRIETALKKIEQIGPQGQTNMQAGVQVGAVELIGSQSVFTSQPSKDSQMVMIFMSDGLPTLPVGQSIRRNRRLAVEAALKAAKFKIRLETYGIGADAVSQPLALVEMARVTSGTFTPVAEPRDLQAFFQQVDFSEVDILRITNRSNQTEAGYTVRSADGSFSALLEMVPGLNDIEIYVRAKDGTEGTRQLRLNFVKDGTPPALPLRLVGQRNRLLESRLADLRKRSIGLPVQTPEEIRRDLQIRIQNERKKAQERARSIRIEEDPAPDGDKTAPPDQTAPPKK